MESNQQLLNIILKGSFIQQGTVTLKRISERFPPLSVNTDSETAVVNVTYASRDHAKQ